MAMSDGWDVPLLLVTTACMPHHESSSPSRSKIDLVESIRDVDVSAVMLEAGCS